MALGTRVLMGIPTLTSARRSVAWIDALAGLQMPLGSSLGRVWIENETIAAARNALCEKALAEGVDYLVMLGDDVLPPPQMLLMMLDKIGREFPVENGRVARCSMLTGVYWTKTWPTEPYLWNGLLRGSYRDWKVGEFFPVDLAGCDALMVEVAALREMPRPWFSTEWTYGEGERVSPIATEDFYFFTKARKAGLRLFVDTAIQCYHEDRATGQMFGLSVDMPQAGGVPEGGDDALLVAELGSGTDLPTWGPNCVVTRFDIRAEVEPDVRCDISRIPDGYLGLYDVVHARHVLEHFGRADAPGLVRHWVGLLKPGGRLIVRVPNIEAAIRNILDGHPQTYDWSQLYGGQAYPYDFHKNGFTERKLKGLLAGTPGLTNVTVELEQDGDNLKGVATFVGSTVPEAIGPWWDDIRAAEAVPEPVVCPTTAGPPVAGAGGDATPAPVPDPDGVHA